MASSPTTTMPPAARRARTASGVCNLALLTIGVYTALLGPVLPEIARRADVSLGNAGALFTAVFGAAIVSTALAGWAVDQFGGRRVAAAGLALNGLALLAIPWAPSFPGLLGAAALLGFGDGAVIVAVHTLVARLNPEQEAAALNRLNVFFGIGAILGPALAAASRTIAGRGVLALAPAGVLQLVYSVVLARAFVPAGGHDAHHVDADSPRSGLLRTPLLWLLAVLLLVYVGVEIGLGGWAFTYARDAADLSDTAAALLSSGFWCALTLSRLCSPVVLRRLTPAALLVVGPAVACAGTLALVLAGETPAVLVGGVLLAGFGFGPVWPVAFALAARAFPHAAGSAGGVLAMVSAVGGLGIPWLQGRVLEGAGPTAGIGVTFAGCAILIGLATVVRRRAMAG